MSNDIIEIFEKASVLNYAVKDRSGNIISLSGRAEIIVTGDLHGHRRNFERIVTFADLENNPDRHVILQEIIHGGPEDSFGGCMSFQLLLDVLNFRIRYPDRVHIIMGNHDTAVICNKTVMKAGKEMNHAMRAAMQRHFETDYDDVDCAMKQYLLSQPLAVRCANRIWISHSLPANRYADSFDTDIFCRKLSIADTERPNAAYLLTWGRKHSFVALEKFAKLLDVDMFILGHQPQEAGWAMCGNNVIILASDHNHGCLLPFDLSRSYTIEQLAKCILPLASIE